MAVQTIFLQKILLPPAQLLSKAYNATKTECCVARPGKEGTIIFLAKLRPIYFGTRGKYEGTFKEVKNTNIIEYS